MSAEHADLSFNTQSKLPTDAALSRNIAWRRKLGAFWRAVLVGSLVIALLGLKLLLYKIVDSSFGYVALEYRRLPAALLNNRTLAAVSQAELVTILQENVSAGRFRTFDREAPIAARSKDEVYTLLLEEVARQRVVHSWTLTDSIFRRAAIE